MLCMCVCMRVCVNILSNGTAKKTKAASHKLYIFQISQRPNHIQNSKTNDRTTRLRRMAEYANIAIVSLLL